MTQVLVNLVRNALKFTGNGTVRIMATYDEVNEHICVHVQDNGLGIRPDDQR